MGDMELHSGRYCARCGAAFLTQLDRCPRDGGEIYPGARDPLLDTLLADRYRVIDFLGSGGMGRVYRVQHATLGKTFALKVMFGELSGNQSMVSRFHREAEALSRLSHRNVVCVIDFGATYQGLLYLVTEHVAGRRLVDEPPALGMGRTVHIIRQIGRALAHAHERGVVHRDLKPDNVVLAEEDGEQDIVKLLDFGTVSLQNATGSAEQLTANGVLLGTPQYMSPEQARGHVVDARADLYSLGVMMYEMLAGQLPFRSDSIMDVIAMHMTQPPPPIRNSVAPEALVEVVMRLLEKKPEDRYPSAESALLAIDLAVRQVKPNLTTDAPWERPVGKTNGEPVVTAPMPRHPVAAPNEGPPICQREANVGKLTPILRDEFRPGEIVDERWEILEVLEGDLGPVYTVIDREWDRQEMVVKRLRQFSGMSMERFERGKLRFRKTTEEWRDLGGVASLVTGFYTLPIRGALHFFMERVHGRALPELMGLGSPVALSRALDLAVQAVRGVEYVHGRGRWHGSVRAANCLITAGHELKWKLDAGDRPEASPTELENIPHDHALYMAPEAWRTHSDTGKASDIYALGVLIYELVTGQRPFDATPRCWERYYNKLPRQVAQVIESKSPNPNAVLRAFHQHVSPIAPGALGVSLPPALDGLISRCLAKEPSARPGARELRQGLLDLAPGMLGTPFGRELASFRPTESAVNHRAACYYVMKERDKARAILDGWLTLDPDAVITWANRKTMAINDGMLEPAAAHEEASALLAKIGDKPLDPGVRAFIELIGRCVLHSGGAVRAVALSPDQNLIVAGGDTKGEVARTWEAGTGKVKNVFASKNVGGGTLCLSVGAGGSVVATGGSHGQVALWSRDNGANWLTFEAHLGEVTAVALSADARLLLTGGSDGKARAWDPTTGRCLATVDESGEKVTAVALSPSGTVALVASGRGARAWDLATGSLLSTLNGHQGEITCVGFGPHGRTAITGGRDQVARTWNSTDGRETAVLSGHDGPVLAACIHPNGRQAFTGSTDRTARAWEIASRQVLRTCKGHRGSVTAIAVGADGNKLITGSEDGTVRTWAGATLRPPERPWPFILKRP
ncbi:MAG: protein kinase [Deltaproteobacteria bacterium]|nr:protein kinase [Deltaproteobacteria bacterium]